MISYFNFFFCFKNNSYNFKGLFRDLKFKKIIILFAHLAHSRVLKLNWSFHFSQDNIEAFADDRKFA